MVPEHLEIALFALGSFQDAEARLGFTRGVWRTCAGYAGGVFPSPSHNDAGDHIEAVRVEYDPQTASYGQLLELFTCWYRTGPLDTTPGHGAVIFVRTAKERRLAQAAVERSSLCCGSSRPPVRVLPLRAFFPAENAWQKYYLHAVPWLYEELRDLYGDEEALLRSTLAARLNGFLRQPSRSALHCLPESADLYGLSASDRQALRDLAS